MLQDFDEGKDAGKLASEAHNLRLEIMTVLNFLDAIAIGVNQKLYVKSLVKDHMQAIIARNVRDLLAPPVGVASGCTPEDYPRLVALNAEWSTGDN